MKKLLASATAVTLLTVGYSSAAFAEKNPNDKDCGHFKDKQEVMEFWHSNGYSATNDPHGLDRDNDGLPCEVKKGDYDQFLASQQSTKKDESKPKEQVKQENTKQTATKAETKKQGEKLPNTASNSVTMMLASAALVLAGSILVFRRKKTNA
ncbi:excalibur calcium-binding domain-containing protein [Bacillus anthracis]|uniref:excalibur calcium-binding domain-containing protein n=1 Tax=Bacillus anthracis TaxID=1392 RepID=UPI001D0E05AB|nr:excalibur calcium-binding domain-containing protein [Bacillus anthracis]MCC2347122.1 excalibur calcium-binding domain-containing protein [Bacillus anthracis]